MSKRLTQYMTAPSRIASALDWKRKAGSIVSLDICRDRIDLSVASHPCNGEAPLSLDSIPLQYSYTNKNMKCLKRSVMEQLHDIVQKHEVCGFVVAWPVQREGRMGAPCGRVLHTLDSMLLSNATLLTPGRKFCLWDGSHVAMEAEDKWGRCEIYGRSSADDSMNEHVASREQYNQWTQGTPDDVWEDFAKAHWPDLCAAIKANQAVVDESLLDYNNGEFLDHYEEQGAYLQTPAMI
mmetsp:Transcript_10319/g.17327  ORF Transcript_10319/g.17327 Transcript_10319/m.17327 type:complete len:237 (-) Transcript_10319:22-732(-)